jgi:hypothetical protein
LGELDTRHLGGFGPRYRPANLTITRQTSRAQRIISYFLQYVENDFRTIRCSAHDCFLSYFRRTRRVLRLGRHHVENNGVQHVRVAPNLQRNQLPPARQQAQCVFRHSTKPLLHCYLGDYGCLSNLDHLCRRTGIFRDASQQSAMAYLYGSRDFGPSGRRIGAPYTQRFPKDVPPRSSFKVECVQSGSHKLVHFEIYHLNCNLWNIIAQP